jgi:DNA-binding response OmpR family regulator
MATVLIVDDDEAVLDLIVEALADTGVETRTATTGAQALEALMASPPDCAVLDIIMPAPSGLDLCTTLRADSRTAAIPVILLTARTQYADIASGFDCGADDYIVKPFDPVDLCRRVTALLSPVRQQRWLRRHDAHGVTRASAGPAGLFAAERDPTRAV